MSRDLTPSPIQAPTEFPRLGGWAELAGNDSCLAKLRVRSPWAKTNLDQLIQLEVEGISAAAEGKTLLHCDVYSHNILLTPLRVMFVDWPHVRVGSPLVDLVVLLTSAASDGLDPESFLTSRSWAQKASGDAILAANAGFLMAGGLSAPEPGLEAVVTAKLHLAAGALRWRHRLDAKHVRRP